MIGYVGIDEQVDKDFHRALRKAYLHRLRARIRANVANGCLPSFDEAKGVLAQWSQACLPGIRPVEVEKITGSVGRCKDFDRSFLPLKQSMASRWERVDRAYHQGLDLPAVSLYKVGEVYFVRDGNHRVSVAKFHKAAAIDAEIVELRSPMFSDAPRAGARTAGQPAHRSQPSESRASWLVNLRRLLRPAPTRRDLGSAA